MSFEGDDDGGGNGRPVNKVTRRTLLQGATLFSGLGVWHAAVTAGSLGVAGALLSVPGQAVARITGCLIDFTHNGTEHTCNPTYDCGSNMGATSCQTQSGVIIACNIDECFTMSANDYNCDVASCRVTFTGDCHELNLCGNQTGNCTRLGDCDDQSGGCNRLQNCDKLTGTCLNLGTCVILDGQCPDNDTCSCHDNGAHGSLAPRVQFHLEEAKMAGRMPYAKSLGSEDE